MQSCCFATDSYLVTTCLFSQTSIEKKLTRAKALGKKEASRFPSFLLLMHRELI